MTPVRFTIGFAALTCLASGCLSRDKIPTAPDMSRDGGDDAGATPTCADGSPRVDTYVGSLSGVTTRFKAGTCYVLFDSGLSQTQVEGGKLILEPGAVLRFERGAGLWLDRTSSLQAVGTADAPILLTGLEAKPGSFYGVVFDASDSQTNRLEHVVIEYAGAPAETSVGGDYFAQAGVSVIGKARATMSEVTLRDIDGAGLLVVGGDAHIAVDHTRFERNLRAVVITPNAVAGLGDGLVFKDNDLDGIWLEDPGLPDLTRDATWPALPQAYRMRSSLTVDADLTLAPGVQLDFIGESSLWVSRDGSLNAEGTSEAPIQFGGDAWTGLVFTSDSKRNVLSHVNIEHAGARPFLGGVPAGSIVLGRVPPDAPPSLVLRDSTIQHGLGAGLAVDAPGASISVSNTRFEGNEAPLRLPFSMVASIGLDNQFVGNERNAIEVTSEPAPNALSTVSWPVQAVPYRVVESLALLNTVWTPSAGMVVELAEGTSISVGANARLMARGTSAAPIRFTGTRPAAGAWGQLMIAGDASELIYVVVEYGGTTGSTPEIDAALLVDAKQDVVLDHVTVRESATRGLHVTREAALKTCDGYLSTDNALSDLGAGACTP